MLFRSYALRAQSANYKLTTYGRVILSSLEPNSAGGQWIHWQRCIGKLHVNSSYGEAGAGATGAPTIVGMGPAGQEIQAPDASGVMFVEVTYNYQPLVSDTLLGAQVLHSHAAFIVRDKRDFSEGRNPTNPAPAVTPQSCSDYAI